MNLLENLNDLRLTLPKISTSGGNYVSVNVGANITYVAIQFPVTNETYLYQGTWEIKLRAMKATRQCDYAL